MAPDSNEPRPLGEALPGFVIDSIGDDGTPWVRFVAGKDTPMSADGMVIQRVGFTLVRNDHHQRLLHYAQGVPELDGLKLLGLYVHMAGKPHGWRFDAGRLAHELGVGRNAVLLLLRHMKQLGYYRQADTRTPEGKLRRVTVFDAGTVGAEVDVHDIPEPALRDATTEVPTGVLRSDQQEHDVSAGRTEVPSPNVGSPNVGSRYLLVNTESQYSESVSHPAPTEQPKPPDKPSPLTDLTDWKHMLEQLPEPVRPFPNGPVLAACERAARNGWTPAAAQAELLDNAHPHKGAGPGTVVWLLRQLPPYTPEAPTWTAPDFADVMHELDVSTWCEHENPPSRCPECRQHRARHDTAVNA